MSQLTIIRRGSSGEIAGQYSAPPPDSPSGCQARTTSSPQAPRDAAISARAQAASAPGANRRRRRLAHIAMGSWWLPGGANPPQEGYAAAPWLTVPRAERLRAQVTLRASLPGSADGP